MSRVTEERKMVKAILNLFNCDIEEVGDSQQEYQVIYQGTPVTVTATELATEYGWPLYNTSPLFKLYGVLMLAKKKLQGG